ncbi:hypothetical protein ACLI09_10505 [Flavobacterium sp. RHBU_24]|uniref:hypothetical protein n=1 Tax=Flavobacterium sp. RHBU_24 TaxID=3391185 RepID=UPI00398541B5
MKFKITLLAGLLTFVVFPRVTQGDKPKRRELPIVEKPRETVLPALYTYSLAEEDNALLVQ